MQERLIICKDVFGKEHPIQKEKLHHREAACGILLRNKRILLIQDSYSQQWELPGGGVEQGETVGQALVREFEEETGLVVKKNKLLTYRDTFFYDLPVQTAYNAQRKYFSVVDTDPNVHPTSGTFLRVEDLRPETTNELTFSVLSELFPIY